MRNAYALLGLSFLIVFVGAFLIFQKAHAPTPTETLQAPLAPDRDTFQWVWGHAPDSSESETQTVSEE